MATDRVIGIVVAVVLFSFLLLLGLNILGDVRLGIGDILDTGGRAMDRLDPVVVHENCRNWMAAGSGKFDPINILEVYQIPRAFEPYDRFWMCCGEPLKNAAETALRPDSDRRVVRGDVVYECEVACSSAEQAYLYCNRQCPTDSLRVRCFDFVMSEATRPCSPGGIDPFYRECEVR